MIDLSSQRETYVYVKSRNPTMYKILLTINFWDGKISIF